MTYVNRYNVISNRWELGYYIGARFMIVCTYPQV